MRMCEGMGKLVFGMMQSLDGYVDGVAGGLKLPPAGVTLHQHFSVLAIVSLEDFDRREL